MTSEDDYNSSTTSSDEERRDPEFAEDTEPGRDNWDPDKFCQVVITETIIALSQILSQVFLEDSGLLITRSGMELAYGRQMIKRLQAHLQKEVIKDIGPLAFCLQDAMPSPHGIEEDDNKDGVELRLRNALELFSGRTPPPIESNYSALCANGICAFLDILCAHGSVNASIDSASTIHILPGRIVHEYKHYAMLTDRRNASNNPGTGFTDASMISQLDMPHLVRHLYAREAYSGLEIWLEIEVHEETRGVECKIQIGPWQLAESLTTQRRLVSCKKLQGLRRVDCPTAGLCMKDLKKVTAENPLRMHDKLVHVLKFRDTDSAVAALASTADLRRPVYITDAECLPCCVRDAIAVEDPDATELCILRFPP
jgi:hypothetical protein